MGKLINRIPGSSLAMSTSVLKALPGKLDIKRHSPSILFVSFPDLCHPAYFTFINSVFIIYVCIFIFILSFNIYIYIDRSN